MMHPIDEIYLTHDMQLVATEPQREKVRELFELLKRAANDDGTIPGNIYRAISRSGKRLDVQIDARSRRFKQRRCDCLQSHLRRTGISILQFEQPVNGM